MSAAIEGIGGAEVPRYAGEHALEFLDRRPDAHSAVEVILADCCLVSATAVLQHRDGFAHLASRLEVAQENNGIGEEAHVKWGLRAADHPMLRHDQDRR